jgi:hypothetical protein
MFQQFLNHWKRTICAEGFEEVRYESIVKDDHRGHGFVFRTTENFCALMKQSQNPSEEEVNEITRSSAINHSCEYEILFGDGLWINSDFKKSHSISSSSLESSYHELSYDKKDKKRTFPPDWIEI